jgi:glycoprotein endo-alpha-1,2-mannosidase
MSEPCQPNVNISFTLAPICRGVTPSTRRISVLLVVVIVAAVGLAACGSTPPTATPSHSAAAATSTATSVGTPETTPSSGASPSASPTPTTLVTAFYYLWYGTAAHDGAWRHWNQLNHQPPDDIASSFYPLGGPYSSRDPAVLAAQMSELRSTGIGAIAVSWWGQGSWDDQSLDALFAAATAAGIRIAFHLEPYTGQTAASVAADIRYLIGRFGSSPALLRISRSTAASGSTAARPVFYLFAASRLPTADLKASLDGLRGTPNDAIVMIHSPKASSAVRDGGDGVYTYDALASPGDFATLVSDCRSAKIICSPSVSPGFDNHEAVATGQLFVGRQNGARYDAMWQAAISAGPEWISVTTFNEWHEGTQIEPAQQFTGGARSYAGYDGAYGAAAADAPDAYLSRTAHWVRIFEAGG